MISEIFSEYFEAKLVISISTFKGNKWCFHRSLSPTANMVVHPILRYERLINFNENALDHTVEKFVLRVLCKYVQVVSSG